MDIQKAASTSAYALAEIKRQRELIAVQGVISADPRIMAGVENASINVGDHSAGGVVSSDKLKAVLDRLNQPTQLRKEAEEQRTAQYQTILSARTKHALNAYRAQFDLPQYEAKSALSQMLGVDVYA